MSYPAIVYNIMLSSPSDAKKERKILRDAIYKWNDANKNIGIILYPVDCDHNVPATSGGCGQDIINNSIVKSSDWLVAVFKDTYGSPTGREDSGTVEEIKLFKNLKRENPISIYFYKNTQDRKIKRFKERIGKDCLWKEYTNKRDLKDKFFIHISQIVFTYPCFKERPFDPWERIEKNADMLLIIMGNNKASEITFLTLLEEPIIQIGNFKFFGCKRVLNLLCDRGHLKQVDKEGERFQLTLEGRKRIDELQKHFIGEYIS